MRHVLVAFKPFHHPTGHCRKDFPVWLMNSNSTIQSNKQKDRFSSSNFSVFKKYLFWNVFTTVSSIQWHTHTSPAQFIIEIGLINSMKMTNQSIKYECNLLFNLIITFMEQLDTAENNKDIMSLQQQEWLCHFPCAVYWF